MSRRNTPTPPRDIGDEVRRLQKLSALIACLQHAVNYDVSDERQVDVSDALAAVVLLIDYEIESLGELAHQEELVNREVSQ